MKSLDGYDPVAEQHVSLMIHDGHITAVSPIDTGDTLPNISYGFVDIQVNGYKGLDYSSGSLTAEQLRDLVYTLARHGVTQHFPTIISSSHEDTQASIKIIVDAVENDPLLAAAIPGIHLEGPYISSVDGPRGAHSKQFVRDADVQEFASMEDAAKGMIRMVTLAPERNGSMELISYLRKRGVLVSIGHTAALPEEIHAAAEQGATFSTHLGNGSHADIPRLQNYIWAQLADERLTISIITDGYHLPEDVIKTFYKVKGPEKTLLTSDVAPMGGLDPGAYKWKDLSVTVYDDGHLGQTGTGFLAGSGHLLDDCLSHFMATVGVTDAEALSLVTAVPKQVFDLDKGWGVLKPNTPANLVVYEKTDGAVVPIKTILNGEIIY